MSWNSTAYFSDARALLLTEHVIVVCVYAAHARSFNCWMDYSVLTLLHLSESFIIHTQFTHPPTIKKSKIPTRTWIGQTEYVLNDFKIQNKTVTHVWTWMTRHDKHTYVRRQNKSAYRYDSKFELLICTKISINRNVLGVQNVISLCSRIHRFYCNKSYNEMKWLNDTIVVVKRVNIVRFHQTRTIVPLKSIRQF